MPGGRTLGDPEYPGQLAHRQFLTVENPQHAHADCVAELGESFDDVAG